MADIFFIRCTESIPLFFSRYLQFSSVITLLFQRDFEAVRCLAFACIVRLELTMKHWSFC